MGLILAARCVQIDCIVGTSLRNAGSTPCHPCPQHACMPQPPASGAVSSWPGGGMPSQHSSASRCSTLTHSSGTPPTQLVVERSSMKTICHKGSWYLIGGEQQGFATTRALYTPLQSLVDSSLHKLGSVSCVKAIPPIPKTYSAISVIGDKIISIGGSEGDESTPSVTIYALSEDPASWVEVGELPLPIIHGTAVATSNHEVLLIGGRGENNTKLTKVYRLYLQESTSHKDTGTSDK